MLTDIIIVLLVILNAISGYRRGLFNMLGRLAVILVSLILTLLMLSPFSSWLSERPFMQPLEERISQPILEPLRTSEDNIGSVIENMNLPDAIEMLLMEQIPEQDEDFTQAYPEFSAALFRLALMAAVFIFAFAVLAIGIHLLTRSLTAVTDKVPLLGLTNRLAGLAVGLAFAGLQLTVLVVVLGLLSPYSATVSHLISRSAFLDWVYSTDLAGRLF